MSYRIGIDGGGTKTECILVDARGDIVARHIGPGCNPNVAGPDAARQVIVDALAALLSGYAPAPPDALERGDPTGGANRRDRGTTARDTAASPASAPIDVMGKDRAAGAASATPPGASSVPRSTSPLPISHLHIYAAGNRAWWRDTAAGLGNYGRVFTADDSHPVLELATHGQPGLVVHAGTGSFVAARAPDGSVHYAGGIGWRFGDHGSGYDLGRRAIGHALLELQGWEKPTALSATVRAHTQLGDQADAAAVTRFFYQHAEPNRQIAALAPALLTLAQSGDPAAREVVRASLADLLALASRVASTLFPGTSPSALPAGLSGPILTHPAVLALLATSPFRFAPVQGTPIEGVRRLLLRAT